MTVLHLTLSLARGGRRSAICSLVDGLQGIGIECRIGCLNELGCEPEEVAPFADRFHVLHKRSLLDRRALGELVRVCRQHNLAIIHAHDAASQFAGALVKLRLPHVRLLMTFHRSLPIDSTGIKNRTRNALACLATDAIVTGSRERRDHFLANYRIAARKVVRIPFGVDTARFARDVAVRRAVREEWGLPAKTVVVGVVGHFGLEKGVDVAIRGFQALASALPRQPLALVIVGQGTPEQTAKLQELAARTPQAHICFAGFLSDIPRCIQAFDILLHAPRQEAFGLAMAEAMAAGLPVVATRTGGASDIVRDRHTGYLVANEDATGVGESLARLVLDPDERERFGSAGLAVARAEYDALTFATRYAQLYRDLLEGRAPRGADEGPESTTYRVEPNFTIQTEAAGELSLAAASVAHSKVSL